MDGQEIRTTEQLASAGTAEEVHGLGLGFCLVDGRVLSALAQQRSAGGPPPFFDLEMIGDGTDFRGEDFYFFERVRKAGFTVHLDHRLSWSIGHVVERTLKNGDGGG